MHYPRYFLSWGYSQSAAGEINGVPALGPLKTPAHSVSGSIVISVSQAALSFNSYIYGL